MKEYTKQEITELEIYLNNRLDQVELMQDKEEMTQRGDVLLNVFKVLQNYEELAPLLTEFLDKKHYKEKWGVENFTTSYDNTTGYVDTATGICNIPSKEEK